MPDDFAADWNAHRGFWCTDCGHPLNQDAVFCPRCCKRVEHAEEHGDYVYEAFISYRHHPLDEQVAKRIQKGLEGMRIPRHLQKDGERTRLGKLFRDQDELPTSSSLSDQIESALKQSRFLIVVASPRTNESLWVRREVELFSSFHGRDRILVALAEGEPSESFPPLLLSHLERDASGKMSEVNDEPLAADFRSVSRKETNTEVLRLAAPIIGCGFDDLRQRMRARRMRLVAGLSTVIAAASIIFGAVVLHQNAQIAANYRQAQINESEFLATEANDLLSQGDRYEAVQVALAALPNADDPSRPFVPAAQLALENALEVYPSEALWRSSFSITNVQGFELATSDTGLLALFGTDRHIKVYDMTDGSLVSDLDFEAELGLMRDDPLPLLNTLTFAKDRLVFTQGTLVGCIDATTGELCWTLSCENPNPIIAVSPDAQSVAVASSKSELNFQGDEYEYFVSPIVQIVDAETGLVTDTHTLPRLEDINDSLLSGSASFDESGTRLAYGWAGALHVIDLSTGNVSSVGTALPSVESVAFMGDLLVVAERNDSFSSPWSCTVEAFDCNPDPSLRWAHAATDEEALGAYTFTSTGLTYANMVKVCGAMTELNGMGDQVVCVSDREIMLLDMQDGSQTFAIPSDAPYTACSVGTIWDAQCLFACTADGTVMIRNVELGPTSGLAYDVRFAENGIAELVPSENGTTLALLPMGSNKCNVARLEAPRSMPGSVELESVGRVNSVYMDPVNDLVICVDEDSIVALDGTSLEQTFEIPFSDLPQIDATFSSILGFSFGREGEFLAYGVSAGGNYGSTILRISAKDGSIVDELTSDGTHFEGSGSSVEYLVLPDGREAIAEVGMNFVRILDLDSTEVISEFMPESFIDEAWIGEGGVIIRVNTTHDSTEAGGPYELLLIDPSSGEKIEGDICGCSPAQDGAATVGGKGDSLFVVALTDGSIAGYDARTGGFLWQTEAFPSRVQHLAIDEQTGNVLVQFGTGICQLLSSSDGHVLATSSTALPPIKGSVQYDGETLLVNWRRDGFGVSTGMALVSVSEDSFGPVSNLPYCCYVGPDGGRAVVLDTTVTRLYAIDHYSREALVDLAYEMTEGHELTDAERRLYRI